MFPILLACNSGAFGGAIAILLAVLAGVVVMTVAGIIASVVYVVQFSTGRNFSTAGLAARILGCAFLFAPALGLTVLSLG